MWNRIRHWHGVFRYNYLQRNSAFMVGVIRAIFPDNSLNYVCKKTGKVDTVLYTISLLLSQLILLLFFFFFLDFSFILSCSNTFLTHSPRLNSNICYSFLKISLTPGWDCLLHALPAYIESLNCSVISCL